MKYTKVYDLNVATTTFLHIQFIINNNYDISLTEIPRFVATDAWLKI